MCFFSCDYNRSYMTGKEMIKQIKKWARGMVAMVVVVMSKTSLFGIGCFLDSVKGPDFFRWLQGKKLILSSELLIQWVKEYVHPKAGKQKKSHWLWPSSSYLRLYVYLIYLIYYILVLYRSDLYFLKLKIQTSKFPQDNKLLVIANEQDICFNFIKDWI